MVKKNFHCEICAKIGKIFRCKFCQHTFCRDCILTANPEWALPSTAIENEIGGTLTIGVVEGNVDVDGVDGVDGVEEEVGVEGVNGVDEGGEIDLYHMNLNNTHQSVNLENDGFLDFAENIPEVETIESNCQVVNYCAFNCLKSLGENYCYDCGGNYMRNRRCLSCNYTFCSMCQKNNLYDTKNILPEYQRQSSLFCSKTCYEIYTEQPNNDWCICENCGAEYFDIAYKKCCDLCLEKYHFHNHNIYNSKRSELIKKLTDYIQDHSINLKLISEKIVPILESKVKQHPTIKELKITLQNWYTSICVGNNLSYNIWDEVISDFLIKN